MNKISSITAYEILDSRGNPTVEVEIVMSDGSRGVSSAPSGASTGSKEAHELRDNDLSRFHGKGVLSAISNVNNIIAPKIINTYPSPDQLDRTMILLDGTEEKSQIGANAMVATSIAYAKAYASSVLKTLPEYIADRIQHHDKKSNGGGLEIMVNVINGGAHADNNLGIQEFMLIPSGIEKINEKIRCANQIYHTLKKLLKKMGQSVNVGDEGGFAPNLETTDKTLEVLSEAITIEGYNLGVDVNIALDVAANELVQTPSRRGGKEHDNSRQNCYQYSLDGKYFSSTELVNYFSDIRTRYHVSSIEDILCEDDLEGWKYANDKLGMDTMLIGDDLLVTNPQLLKMAIDEKLCNGILIKVNQIGTLTESLESVSIAMKHGLKIVISHRSGETEDTFIADFALGLAQVYDKVFIKTGGMSRMERIAKYNHLIRQNTTSKPKIL